ncbi:PaaX family transcriptional regulator [Spiractinospora alimapuensis]|uniref:PaaX family transcriptional regulator n=1 Tax=Spiractinospora alimapuensis TaxID=2820884 RepID=UPI001F168BE1|nr:PaaX family transcriptional regulator C-terminal domain-containing protein [Spiractinospora alimapuensis]
MTLNVEPENPGEVERPTRRPRSLIVSFFGSYGRDIGGWVSVADLIALMGELDVEPPAVRSAVSRLKRRGLLAAERIGGVAGYRLSEAGLRILTEGDRRIFHHTVGALSEGWVLVVFSVPESQRNKRHVLRSQLAWLGFGTTTAGVWLAPAHLEPEARAAIRDLGMSEYVELFRATHLGFSDLTEAVARWWDLPALQRMYESFLADHEPELSAWRRSGAAGTMGAAFASHLRAVDAWRRMPFLDPGLPPEVLPEAWAGSRAARVFFDLHALLREPGLAHVREVTGAPG